MEANGNNSKNGKRKKVFIILMLLIACIAAGIIYFMRYSETHIMTDDAFIDGDITYVSSLIPGKLIEVNVSNDQFVEKDQVLARIDTTDIDAELNAARENLEVVRNEVSGKYAQIRVVDSQVAQINAQIALVVQERNRAKELLERGAVSQDEYDKVEAQWKALRAQAAATRKQKTQIKTSIGPKDEAGKEAAIRLAEARIRQIEIKLDHAIIKAPVAGYIARKNIAVGQVVEPGAPLMAIVPLDELYITANYKETELTRVSPGQSVVFKVDTYPGVKFQGRVKSIMAGTGSVFSLLPPQNATGSYIKVVQRIPVKIAIIGHDKDKYPFRLGMSVVPTILVQGK